MYMDVKNQDSLDYAVIFNNKLQSFCFEADDKKGYIKRYIKDEDGKVLLDENKNVKAETLYGKVEFIDIHVLDAKYLEKNNIEVE